MTIRVYKYGLCPPLDWDEGCDAEMARATAFWNALVAIEQTYQLRRASIMDDGGEIAALVAQIDAAYAAKDKALGKTLSAQRKELSTRLRAERKDALAESETARRESAKAARQACGLYWGNYNAIAQSYDVARQRVIKDGAEMRPHDENSDWRISVQIQGGMSVADALGGGKTQFAITAPNGEGSRKARLRGQMRMTVHNTGGLRAVTWPLVYHRPIPADAMIMGAQVVRRRRIGARWHDWHLCVTVREPDYVAPPSPAISGLNIGWRRRHVDRGLVREGDGLRIATLWDGAQIREVILPERIIDMARRVDDLTGEIDSRVNDAVMRLRRDAPARAKDIIAAERPTAGMLWALMRDWPDAPPWLPRTVSRNRRDARERAGLNRRIPLARREIYRIAVKEIAEQFGAIAICDVDWARMARLQEPVTKEKNSLPPPGRGYRKIAAPGEFEAELRRAIAARGGTLRKFSDAMTPICHACGASNTVEKGSQHCTCAACRATWDVDYNAARNLFAALRTSGSETTKTPDSLEPEKKGYEGRYHKAKRLAAEKSGALENGGISSSVPTG